jgi:hypothetical protein
MEEFLIGLVLGIILMYVLIQFKEKNEYKFISIILFIAILGLLAYDGFLFLKGNEVTDVNRLTALSSFISTILGFSGTYTIFHLTRKKEIDKANNDAKKEIARRDEEAKKEEEYAQDMLFSLLRYTMEETELIVKLIHSKYLISTYQAESKTIKEYLKKTPKDEYNRLCTQINKLKSDDSLYVELQQTLDKYLKSNLVYDDNWTKYLKYEEHSKRKNVIDWINCLRNKDLDVDMFLIKRSIVSIMLQLKEHRHIGESDKYTTKIQSNTDLIEENMNRFKY